MIITRTPFRISFAGGGSDLRDFYCHEPGCILSTTIDKYMYIAIHPYFETGKTFIKYSKTEIVEKIADIQHPIVRQMLGDFRISGIDITSIADILAGTGLGSSSSYTVGLLHALYAYQGKFVSKRRLAEEACAIEIDKLGDPIGKQDQYAAAFGGLNFMTFYPDETVNVEPVTIPAVVRKQLDDNLLMFYTGNTRSAKDILRIQRQHLMSSRKKIASIRRMTELAKQLRSSLYRADLDDFGNILHEGWMLKKEMAQGISNEKIDYYYDRALQHSALGGKLLGAGGGGFLLFYCTREQQNTLIHALQDLRHYKFKIDLFGSKVVYVGEGEEN